MLWRRLFPESRRRANRASWRRTIQMATGAIFAETDNSTYERGGNLMQSILTLLQDPADLTRMDAFNSRGHVGRMELLKLLEKHRDAGPLDSDDDDSGCWLDVGCGVGGTLRYLWPSCSNLVGVDVTLEYIQVARELQKLFFPQQKIQYLHGSALQLPLPTNSVDVVWTEHVQMNIADKDGLYQEIARVLRPRGYLAFHDVVLNSKADTSSAVVYPCPWADTVDTSHLVTAAQLQDALQKAGLELLEWRDTTQETIEFLTPVVKRNRQRA